MSKFIFLFFTIFVLAGFFTIQNNSKVPKAAKETTSTRSKEAKSNHFSVGEKIKFARLERKKTTREVAEAVGIALSQYERIERNEVMPSQETYEAINRVLGIEGLSD